MSEAKQIAQALSGRIKQITVAGGYITDIGTRVFRGKRRIDESQIPCAVIVEGDDNVAGETKRSNKLEQQYFIEGHSVCDPDNPNDAAHDIIEDVKRAVFSDPRIRPSVREAKYKGRSINPREDGTAFVSASIEVWLTFVEAPEAP